jgi:hypothetical protein
MNSVRTNLSTSMKRKIYQKFPNCNFITSGVTDNAYFHPCLILPTEPRPNSVGFAHTYRAGTRTLVRTEARGYLRVNFPIKLRVLNENWKAVFRQLSNMTLYENCFKTLMIQYPIQQIARWIINNQLLVKGICKTDGRMKLFSTDFAVCRIKCCIVVRRSYGFV